MIAPPTKSPSSTIAAFGFGPNACFTESAKTVSSAPDVPPAMLEPSLKIFPIVFSAALTDGAST